MEILWVEHKDVNKQGFGEKALFNLSFPALCLVLSLWRLFSPSSSPQSWRFFLCLGGVASTVDRWLSCQGTPGCAQSPSVPLLRLGSPPGWSQTGSFCHPSACMGADLAEGPDPATETTMWRVRLLKAAQQPEWAEFPPSGMREVFPRWIRGLCPPRVVAVLMVSLSVSEFLCHTALHTVRNKWAAYSPAYKFSQMPLHRHKAYPRAFDWVHSNLSPHPYTWSRHMTKGKHCWRNSAEEFRRG